MTRDRDTVMLLCVPLRGHVQRMLALAAELARAGCDVHAYAHADFRGEVEASGARFVDLYARHPSERVDATTFPLGCRELSYAAAYAEPLLEELRRLAPSVIVHDSFAVVGAVLGHLAGVPSVNVRSGHNQNVRSIPEKKRTAPRTEIAPQCHMAAKTLASWGLPDVTPYFYLSWTSPDLNLYCEPPAFLRPEERAPFEPLAFFGSLDPMRCADGLRADPFAAERQRGRRRIYVSFGTIIWNYFAAQAVAALEVLADVFAQLDVDVLVSLGGWPGAASAAPRLSRTNVRVEGYVDQWAALAHADLFVTHHGLNSTHEAVFHRVPMLSIPFFADQPHLARRCQELGLAVPLVDRALAPVRRDDVRLALARLSERESALRARLAEARGWELDVIARRGEVIERIRALAHRR